MAKRYARVKIDEQAVDEAMYGPTYECSTCHIHVRSHDQRTICVECEEAQAGVEEAPVVEQSEELQIGTRVRILRLRPVRNDVEVTEGTIYDYASHIPYPWCVRPDGWAESETGIAYRTEELEPRSREEARA